MNRLDTILQLLARLPPPLFVFLHRAFAERARAPARRNPNDVLRVSDSPNRQELASRAGPNIFPSRLPQMTEPGSARRGERRLHRRPGRAVGPGHKNAGPRFPMLRSAARLDGERRDRPSFAESE